MNPIRHRVRHALGSIILVTVYVPLVLVILVASAVLTYAAVWLFVELTHGSMILEGAGLIVYFWVAAVSFGLFELALGRRLRDRVRGRAQRQHSEVTEDS